MTSSLLPACVGRHLAPPLHVRLEASLARCMRLRSHPTTVARGRSTPVLRGASSMQNNVGIWGHDTSTMANSSTHQSKPIVASSNPVASTAQSEWLLDMQLRCQDIHTREALRHCRFTSRQVCRFRERSMLEETHSTTRRRLQCRQHQSLLGVSEGAQESR